MIKITKYLGIITIVLILSGISIHAATEIVSVIRQDCTGHSNCYTSLADWLADYGGIDFEGHAQGDLVSSDKIAVAMIDDTWTLPDTTPISIAGWITDSTRYIKIYTTPIKYH